MKARSVKACGGIRYKTSTVATPSKSAFIFSAHSATPSPPYS